MSTVSTPLIPADLTPLEIPGPLARVPSLDELRELTAIPDRRVVFRGVDWTFYEELVDSIPAYVPIHVDYDGKDLEILGKGIQHAFLQPSLGHFVSLVSEVMRISYKGLRETTWKRPEIARGVESDQCYFFFPEKLAQCAAALRRHSNNVADYPNPDLAIEIDLSPTQIDRAGIYAAMSVTEVWRCNRHQVIIERLTSEGTYAAVDSSGFLPIQAEEVRRWIIEEDSSDDTAWAKRVRAEMKKKARRLAREARRRGEGK